MDKIDKELIEFEVETCNGFSKRLHKVMATGSLEAREKMRAQLGYGHYVSGVLLNGVRLDYLS